MTDQTPAQPDPAAEPATTAATEPEQAVDDFAVYLLRDCPATHAELSEKLSLLASAVVEHKKKGSLTLTITMTPSKVDGMVEIGDAVKAVIPQPARKLVGGRYVHKGGVLAEHPERQGVFDGMPAPRREAPTSSTTVTMPTRDGGSTR